MKIDLEKNTNQNLEFKKSQKSIPDQHQLSKSIKKTIEIPKKYRKKTEKLRINIEETPRTTFDDIEKRNPR